MALEKIGYKAVATTDGPTLVRRGSAGFFGFVVAGGATVSVTVYDNTAASGAVLYSKTTHAAGDVVHFGGVGLAANQGLFVVVSGASGLVNVMHA